MAMDRLIAVRQRYNNSRSNHFVPVSVVKKDKSSNDWLDGKKNQACLHATVIYLQIFSSNQSESTVNYKNGYTTYLDG